VSFACILALVWHTYCNTFADPRGGASAKVGGRRRGVVGGARAPAGAAAGASEGCGRGRRRRIPALALTRPLLPPQNLPLPKDAFAVVGLDLALFALAIAASALVAWPPLGRRGRAALRCTKPDAVAIMVCGSTKTVALGVPLINVMYGSTDFAGLLATPLIVYHALQILLGGLMLAPMVRRAGGVAPGRVASEGCSTPASDAPPRRRSSTRTPRPCIHPHPTPKKQQGRWCKDEPIIRRRAALPITMPPDHTAPAPPGKQPAAPAAEPDVARVPDAGGARGGSAAAAAQ
jgi:hypothetical protein